MYRLTSATVTICLKTEACGLRSGDDFTEFVTMVSVPLEKTTAVIPGFKDRVSKAGGTSGKTDSESYAFIRDSVDESLSENFESAKAWLREFRVIEEKGSYSP